MKNIYYYLRTYKSIFKHYKNDKGNTFDLETIALAIDILEKFKKSK